MQELEKPQSGLILTQATQDHLRQSRLTQQAQAQIVESLKQPSLLKARLKQRSVEHVDKMMVLGKLLASN